MPEVPPWPSLVLNIGGQGEIAYAVDINNLISPTVDPELFIHSGRFVRADATALPIAATSPTPSMATASPPEMRPSGWLSPSKRSGC